MVKDLWLIRHAESQGNTGQWGGPDPSLSEKGQAQAAKIKGYAELIILSPLRRTMETYVRSGLVCKHMIVSDLFRERMGGGRGEYRAAEDWKRVESDAAFQKRVEAAAAFLRAQPQTRIAVLSHCTFLYALTGHMFQRPVVFANSQILKQTFD